MSRLAGALSLLVPPLCLACGAPVAAPAALCRRCRVALPRLEHPCPRCALPGCARQRCPGRAFDGAWAAMKHAGPARELVHALKHRGSLRAGQEIAAQMAAAMRQREVADGALLVPVPADPWRRRARGVDHARLLADLLHRRGVGTGMAGALRRARAGPQSGRSRGARHDPERLRTYVAGDLQGTTIALVDDVHTTGATLEAAARAARDAGATAVLAVTYTRALPGRAP